ncbi:DUF4390 domain-containing protein [uncultured Ramlibacter sp.]|uniref:DUF4390 domain-containing protein n=1 Tax=uncultured Ramlibacter sp. TaxID=260755 RepID=UPI00262CD2AD|nr:DUF4390 domain-containing protein [uncultured Ramlibacter sp.]
MITTGFITHCWTNSRRLPGRLRAVLERTVRLALACALLAAAGISSADAPLTEISQLRLERSEEGVFLSTNVRFELPAVVEDALDKGIPMFFVAEAVLFRDRWYWYDRQVTSSARHMRLSYQPLTRRWRLVVSHAPIGNSGVALGQTFDTQDEAMAAVQRIYRWRIGEPADLEADARYNVDFRFRLDVSQLPRPFQIGVVGQSDWNITAARNQRLAVESMR